MLVKCTSLFSSLIPLEGISIGSARRTVFLFAARFTVSSVTTTANIISIRASKTPPAVPAPAIALTERLGEVTVSMARNSVASEVKKELAVVSSSPSVVVWTCCSVVVWTCCSVVVGVFGAVIKNRPGKCTHTLATTGAIPPYKIHNRIST